MAKKKKKKKAATTDQIEAYYKALKDSAQNLPTRAAELGVLGTNGRRKIFEELKVPGQAFVLLRENHPDIRIGKNYGSYLRTLARGSKSTMTELLSYLRGRPLNKAAHLLLRLFWMATRSRNGHWVEEANRILTLLDVERPQVASAQLGLNLDHATTGRVNSITQATTVAAPTAAVVTEIASANVPTEQKIKTPAQVAAANMLVYTKARSMAAAAIAREGQSFINKLAIYNGFWSSLPTQNAVVQFQTFSPLTQAEAIVVFEEGKGLR